MRQCLLFVIDESAAMSTPVARVADAGLAALQPASKSKLESVATALNALIAGLQRQPVDVGLVGYQANPDGSVDVSSRWPPALSGREIVPSRELAGNEATIERRVRKVPRPDGGIDEQAIDFPVWYVPQLGQGHRRPPRFNAAGTSWSPGHARTRTRTPGPP